MKNQYFCLCRCAYGFAVSTLVLFFPGFLKAQNNVSGYTFQQTVGTYAEITGGTVLGDASIDEQIFMEGTAGQAGTITGPGYPIGFSFSFGSEVFTRIGVSTNGYIKLGNGTFTMGSSVSGAFTQTPFNLADTANFANLIAPLHADLQAQAASPIRIQTIGTAPNRELVVQWKNVRYWNTIDAESLNFQIRLQENGNKVVLCYGDFQKSNINREASVGMRGMAYDDVFMRRARVDSAETWITSSGSVSRGSRCDVRAAFKPETGTTYIFTPLPRIPQDLALRLVRLPEAIDFGCAGSASETIRVVVSNRGTLPVSGFVYGMKVNGAAVGSGPVSFTPPLSVDETREISLPASVNMTGSGEYKFIVWSSLDGDTGAYRVNDTTRRSFRKFAPMAVPAPGIPTLGAFAWQGWKAWYGKQKPVRLSTRFQDSNLYYSFSTSISFSGFGTDSIAEWMISPAFVPPAGARLKFRLALSLFDTVTGPAGIGDDQIKIRYTSDCGQTWNDIRTFTNADVVAGVLSSKRTGFSIPIDNLTGPVQLAFFFANQSTAAPVTYSVHLDDVTLSLGNAFDLAATRLFVDNQNNPTCSLTQFPMQLRVRNTGDSVVTSSAVSVQVNNQAPVIQNVTFTPVLNPGDSAVVLFPSVTVPTNTGIRVIGRTRLSLEDGFSTANDTASYSFIYVGSASPLPIPVSIVFDNLPTTAPAGWLVDQGLGSDFRVRVRGTNSSRSLSANLYSNNKTSFAITPTTAVLPPSCQLSFNLRFKNDLAQAFSMGPQDSLAVRVSSDCGASWTTVFRVRASTPLGFDNFALATADLSDFSGKAVAIRFDVYLNRSDFQGAWLDLDNIGVSVNTSVEETLASGSGPVLFPNPGTGSFRVLGLENLPALQTFRLVQPDGKQVAEGPLPADRKFGFFHLPAGIYYLELNGTDEKRRLRLVKW